MGDTFIATSENLEQLQLTDLEFCIWPCPKNDPTLQVLEDFVKTQKNIESFTIDVLSTKTIQQIAIMRHILSLETLRSLRVHNVHRIDALPDLSCEKIYYWN